MESRLSEENPTTGDSGASIQERLEQRLFPAEGTQENKPQPEVKDESNTEDATKAEPEKTEPENGDPQDAQQPQLSTADLALILGIDEGALDVGEDGKVQLKTKIDGKEGAAKLAEVLKTYQLQGHVDNRSRAVAEQEKALQSRMQEVERQVQARVQQAEQLANVAQAQLQQQYQSIDWNTLRQTDPGQYAALQEDFRQRSAQIGQVLNVANQQKQSFFTNLEGERQKLIDAEAQRLPELIPDWKNPEVHQRETQEILKLAQDRGVPDVLMTVMMNGMVTPAGVIPTSAGLVSIFRDALQFQKQQQSKPLVENKVRKAPVIVKPGQAQKDTKETNLRDLAQQVRKTGGKGGSVEAWLKAKGIV